ncbi:MAG: bifunctional sulfate adenylyltransferase subunit 1/adenylylsulfate kinase [Bacteroidetes bacterium GWF2_42_66]|nr:MAG: bifunctional sulfate adenylyltransferase subunit 1/adenylylsulfate kinase [Bacteroidetes bacterium GWA2_42_15]OFX96337.1 MAG: bifunctional sulfate adenylyltransferase subunit 1/adenylylsulfate kinase [Bacteroidetes bacterium GWE2_42_39]OFY46376.1 MAG: bifunctional sulfate adenylyltransferase subunit 1/adenylylsulfate kinase [Bacteroidetes bacterium GWF2_42_66]HBL78237.1 sulfate adenylyltransferase subunit CysN [Prolixibacteraceae bacterium]HCU60157.1 sulfate adenylyltransferase subunit 
MTQNIDINAFLNQDEKKDLLRLLTAGSVDDGKSTLIGRLLFDSKRLYEDQLAALERDSKRVGHAGEEIDYALLLDGLKAEREQGITIDVAYRYFSTNKRKFIIADTPGHEQYTRNMVTGASTANLAIILIDATKGVITQTRRHTFLVSLLGIRHVVLAVNKMDLVNYDQKIFDSICKDYKAFVTQLDIPDVHFIPLSALKGENVVDTTNKMPWYHGKSMLEFLETVHISSDRNFDDMRYPVQYVLRPDRDFRGFSARVASGVIRKGEEIMVLPSRKTSRIKSITTYDGELDEAFPPQSVTITLEDEIDISRGDMIVYPDNLPRVERHFEAMLVWMDEKPMNPDTHFFIKHANNTTKVRIDNVRYRVDVNTLEKSQVSYFSLNEIGRVIMTTNKPIFFDPYKKNRSTGSFVLIDPVTHNTCAVGMIIDKLNADELPSRIGNKDEERLKNLKIERGECLISVKERQQRYNQKGGTIWITGLHGSKKNDLAFKLEKELFDRGATVVLLDGSSVRSGLSRELDFSSADRAEHLRRAAEVCRLLNDQGIITICSFISPDDHIRKQVAEIIGEDRFLLVYMDATLDYCRNYKPLLYQQAEEGLLEDVPGFQVPYEKPQQPLFSFKPEDNGKNLETLIRFLEEEKIFPLV